MSTPIDVTLDNFETEILGSSTPVVLDFWAPWCGPCKRIGPVLKELAVQYDGRVRVAKINVDDEKELASLFKVRGIPALFVLKDGKQVDSVVGFGGRGALAALFEKHA